MQALSIPVSAQYVRRIFCLGALLQRVSGPRATWTDLGKEAGIYVVYCEVKQALHFEPHSGTATYAKTTNPEFLGQEWQRINERAPTDIVYIGKGDNIRKRVRLLVRFGVGRADNHHGGEWMWQIQEIKEANVLTQTCPVGRQKAFENWLLERFREEHGCYPLANQKGPEGPERWHPGIDA